MTLPSGAGTSQEADEQREGPCQCTRGHEPKRLLWDDRASSWCLWSSVARVLGAVSSFAEYRLGLWSVPLASRARYGLHELLGIVVLVLSDLAAAFAQAARRDAWASVDDWLRHAEHRWSPHLLVDIPHRHVLAVTGVLRHRRTLAHSIVLGWFWVTLVAVSGTLWARDISLVAVGFLAAATFLPVFLAWVAVLALCWRLERRVRREAAAVASLSPVSFPVVLNNYLGPVESWRVSLMWPSIVSVSSLADEHPVRSGCVQRWASREAERTLAASGLTASQLETFEVLARDGYMGSVDDLLEVSRRL